MRYFLVSWSVQCGGLKVGGVCDLFHLLPAGNEPFQKMPPNDPATWQIFSLKLSADREHRDTCAPLRHQALKLTVALILDF